MDRASPRASTSSTPPTSTASTPARAAPRRSSARWFGQGGERREKTVLATKVYGGMSDWPNDTFLPPQHRPRLDASLRRMQTDWIDLYQFHHVDLRTPWEEIWQACETLVAQGKVLYVGSSNHAAWQIAAANEAAARAALPGPGQRQSHYNLLTRHVELEVLPAARALRRRDHPGARWPAACSAAGEARGGTTRRGTLGEADRGPPPGPRGVRGVLSRHRTPPADVGLAWLLHQPAVSAPIVGPRTMEQLEGSLRAGRDPEPGQLTRLDEIFPGYKAAPMEYAW